MEKKISALKLIRQFSCLLLLLFSPSLILAQELSELLKELKSAETHPAKVLIYKRIGAYYQNQEAYQKAISYFQKAATLEKQAQEPDKYYRTLGQIAIFQELLLDYDLAIASYDSILAYQKTQQNKIEIRKTLQKLSRICREMNQTEKAIQYNQEILGIENDVYIRAQTFNNLGYLYRQANELDKSLQYYKTALTINQNSTREAEDLYQQAIFLTNQGVTQSYLKDFKKAESNYQEALKLFEQIGNKERIPHMHNYLAANSFLSSHYQEAILRAQKALELAKMQVDEQAILMSYKILSEAYEKDGDFRESRKYLRMLKSLTDKINENERKERQRRLEEQIKIEKEEYELSALLAEKENQALALRQSQLEREKQSQDLKIKENELALLKQNQALQKAEFKNQQLERERVEQLLQLAEQKALTERQKRANDSIQQNALRNRLLAEKQKIENEKNQKALEASQKDRELKEQQLVQEKTQRKFFYLVFILILLLALLLLIGFWHNQKRNKKLKRANEKVKEKNEELLSSEEELRQNMEELTATQEAMRLSKTEVEKTNQKLKKKNKALTDSIVYAERIQQAVLPTQSELLSRFEDYFVIYRPKDIVSGDFYWYHQIENKTYVAVVDCTGHGVPGAFMSLIGNALLNEIVSQQQIYDTDKILKALHEEVRASLRQKESHNTDGMDLAICSFENAGNGRIQVEFSGAKSSLYYFSNQELFIIKGDRHGIGGYNINHSIDFTKHVFYLNPNDVIYMVTDGFLDMPNARRKRFGEKKLIETIEKVKQLPFPQQGQAFREALDQHSQNTPARDDITFMGLQLSQKMLELPSVFPKKPFGIDVQKREFNFFEYHAHISNADTILSYKGPLTDILLSEFSRDIRRKIHEHPKAGKKVFAIFMELAQNVLYYSKEVNHFENNDRVGSLIILDSTHHYKVITGNLIYKDAISSLSQKCEIVNSLDRESLRAYKRELRNAPSGEESKGAGIGMVQAALTSANPLEYEIKDAGEKFAFFVLSAIVMK